MKIRKQAAPWGAIPDLVIDPAIKGTRKAIQEATDEALKATTKATTKEISRDIGRSTREVLKDSLKGARESIPKALTALPNTFSDILTHFVTHKRLWNKLLNAPEKELAEMSSNNLTKIGLVIEKEIEDTLPENLKALFKETTKGDPNKIISFLRNAKKGDYSEIKYGEEFKKALLGKENNLAKALSNSEKELVNLMKTDKELARQLSPWMGAASAVGQLAGYSQLISFGYSIYETVVNYNSSLSDKVNRIVSIVTEISNDMGQDSAFIADITKASIKLKKFAPAASALQAAFKQTVMQDPKDSSLVKSSIIDNKKKTQFMITELVTALDETKSVLENYSRSFLEKSTLLSVPGIGASASKAKRAQSLIDDSKKVISAYSQYMGTIDSGIIEAENKDKQNAVNEKADAEIKTPAYYEQIQMMKIAIKDFRRAANTIKKKVLIK